jgi:hypothetical protein
VEQQEIVGDIVTEQWLRSHRVAIPRAAGVFKSPTAWVRVDQAGTIVAAGETDQRIVAYLVERKVLNSADIDYAIAYVTCRDAHRAFRKQRGYKSHLDISMLAGGDNLSCEQAAEVFSLVTREIGRKFCDIVEYACDTIRTADTPTNYRPPYREAFSALARAFGRAVKEVRKKKDSGAD